MYIKKSFMLISLYSWVYKYVYFIKTEVMCILMFLCCCFQRVHPLGRGPGGRVLGPGGRLRHRHRGWCRRARHSSTAEAIRRNDPYPHFRWSVGSIRSHRSHLPLHETAVNALYSHTPFTSAPGHYACDPIASAHYEYLAHRGRRRR